MVFLLLSILSSTSVFIVFKLISRNKVNTFSAIIVNYITACSAGFFLSHNCPFTGEILESDWLPLSMILGVIFITMFRLIGQSVQKAGVTTTTVAAKMSVIIPILFTVAIEANDTLTFIKLIGIILALIAVFFTSYKPEKVRGELAITMLPLIIFLGIGILDSMVKFAQFRYVSDEINPIFSGITFLIAGLTGIILLIFNRNAASEMKRIKTWIFGFLLGLANFGSMYFFINALNHVDISTGKQVQGSVIFGINNIGIVTLGVIIGFLFFKERPSKLNWSGIALSVLAIVVLTFSQN
jgi:drug/metabolite transporter (DMT)-like permease